MTRASFSVLFYIKRTKLFQNGMEARGEMNLRNLIQESKISKLRDHDQ